MTTLVLWLVFWLVVAVFVAIAAEKKGLNAGAWLLIALLAAPLAAIAVVAVPAAPRTRDPAAPRDDQASEMKTCPDCAEPVRRAALKCRYCGHQFAAASPSASFAPPAARRWR